MDEVLYFTKCQGCKVNENIILQDNKSTLTLEKNRKALSSKRTKQNNMRYYFVKDKFDKGQGEVEYCPTKKMLSDILT